MTQTRYTVAEVAALLKRPGGKVRNVAPRSDRTYAEVVYDSKAEALYAFELDRQKQLGMIWDWKRQVKFPIVVNGNPICRLVVDFGILDESGSYWRYVEVKGFETEVYKIKKKLLLACYPGLSYTVVKV
jgi:hypothetical protein